MNRRHLAVIALLIAVPLFAAPLMYPAPDYEPHLQVSRSLYPTDPGANVTTVQYQNLSSPAQRLFDKRNEEIDTESKHSEIRQPGLPVPLAEAPEPWAILATDEFSEGLESRYLHIVKNDRVYGIHIYRFTPRPLLSTFMLRVGPLLAAIGLGTAAGYFLLTAED